MGLALQFKPAKQSGGQAGESIRLSFAAKSREGVNKFYAAVLKHRAKDNGKPGLGPNYGKSYYAAYIIDLDGYQIEAVYK